MSQLLSENGKEVSFPETVFIRDIESRVFQAITIKCLSGIEGISLLEGSFIDNLLGREGMGTKGIYVEQDPKNHSISVKVELNIAYGVSIPEKAREIQSKLIDQIVKLTGLHVSCVHVVFKCIIPDPVEEKTDEMSNEYAEEF